MGQCSIQCAQCIRRYCYVVIAEITVVIVNVQIDINIYILHNNQSLLLHTLYCPIVRIVEHVHIQLCFVAASINWGALLSFYIHS